MKAPLKPFGRAVRRLREQTEYSQERFAATAGIDRTYMSEIERGLANPSLEMIGRIVHALGMTFSDVFAEVDQELGH